MTDSNNKKKSKKDDNFTTTKSPNNGQFKKMDKKLKAFERLLNIMDDLRENMSMG